MKREGRTGQLETAGDRSCRKAVRRVLDKQAKDPEPSFLS